MIGIISLAISLVAGRKRVPLPAIGIMAFFDFHKFLVLENFFLYIFSYEENHYFSLSTPNGPEIMGTNP